jgi:hypothetical protein
MEVIMATAPKLIPFDPKKHKPVDAQSIGLPNSKPGQKATEYEATEIAPDGQVWNIPSVWFSAESGEAVYIANPDIAGRVARMYEEGTGKKFPRFGLAYNGKDKNVGAFNDAEMAARQRSAGGGATQGSLTDSQQKAPIFGEKQRKLLFNSK